MKNKLFLGSLFCIVLLLFSTCKKRNAFKSEDGQDAEDERFVQSENDYAQKDINEALNSVAVLRGYSSSAGKTSFTICGVSLDTTKVSKGILILNYKNSACGGRTRKGSVQLSVQNYPFSKLKDKGCVVKIEFKGYTAVKKSDGKSIVINGTEYIENISGGTWYELLYLNQPDLVQSLTGQNLNIDFGNPEISGSVYSVSRRYTYTSVNQTIYASIIGTGSDGEKNTIGNWGTTSKGTNYTSEIVSAIEWGSTCGALFPTKGEVKIKADKKDYTLDCVYGVNSSGNASGFDCPYGWKMTWSYKNKSKERVFAY